MDQVKIMVPILPTFPKLPIPLGIDEEDDWEEEDFDDEEWEEEEGEEEEF